MNRSHKLQHHKPPAWHRKVRSWLRERGVSLTSHLDHPWAVIASALLGFVAMLVSVPNWSGLTPWSAVWVFAALPAVAVTILALLFAAIFFRGQYLTTRLPAALVGDLLNPRWQRAAMGRLGTVLLTGLILLADIEEHELPVGISAVFTWDLILLALAMVSIHRGTRHLFSRQYPMSVAQRTITYLTNDYLGSQRGRFRGLPASLATGVLSAEVDPFALIEQVCIRAMNDGDLTTAHLTLRGVAGRLLEFTRTAGSGRYALDWIGELYLVIGRKGLVIDERTTELIIDLLREIVTASVPASNPYDHPYELVESFASLRHAAIRHHRDAVAERGIRTLGRLFEHALASAPPEAKLWMLYGPDEEMPEQDVDADSKWEHVEEWLRGIGDDMGLLADEDMSSAFRTGQYALYYALADVLKPGNLGPRQKRWLIGQILWQAKYAVVGALAKGRSSDFVVWAVHMALRRLAPEGFAEMEKRGLQEWGEVVVTAARAGKLPWIMLNQLAADGRGYAREEKDELASIVVETLAAIAEPLEKRDDPESVERYLQAASALRSIATWDKRERSPTRDAVAREQSKYAREAEILDRWKSVLPARKGIELNDTHARPWA